MWIRKRNKLTGNNPEQYFLCDWSAPPLEWSKFYPAGLKSTLASTSRSIRGESIENLGLKSTDNECFWCPESGLLMSLHFFQLVALWFKICELLIFLHIWEIPSLFLMPCLRLRACGGLMKQVVDDWPWKTATLTPWWRRHFSLLPSTIPWQTLGHSCKNVAVAFFVFKWIILVLNQTGVAKKLTRNMSLNKP